MSLHLLFPLLFSVLYLSTVGAPQLRPQQSMWCSAPTSHLPSPPAHLPAPPAPRQTVGCFLKGITQRLPLRAAFPLVSVTAVLLVALTVDGPPAQDPPPPYQHRHHHHHDGQDTPSLLYVWLCRLLRALTGHKGTNTALPSEPHSPVARLGYQGDGLCAAPLPLPQPSSSSSLQPPQPGGDTAGGTRSPIYRCVCAPIAPGEVTASFWLLAPPCRHSLCSVLASQIKYNLEYYITFKKKKTTTKKDAKMTR